MLASGGVHGWRGETCASLSSGLLHFASGGPGDLVSARSTCVAESVTVIELGLALRGGVYSEEEVRDWSVMVDLVRVFSLLSCCWCLSFMREDWRCEASCLNW